MKVSLIFFSAFICAVFTPYLIKTSDGAILSNSVISILLFAGYFCLFYKFLNEKERKVIFLAYPPGLLFSVFSVFGARLSLYNRIDFSDVRIYCAIIIFSVVFYFLIVRFWNFLDSFDKDEALSFSSSDIRRHSVDVRGESAGFFAKFHNTKYQWLFIWIAIFLCWVPVLLAVYPGFFGYDGLYQIWQYAQSEINALHPPLHTFILGFIVCETADITGDYNNGILLYSLMQMIVISACFAYAIHRMGKWGVAKIIRILSFIYYALFPVISIFVMSSTKDGLFTAFLFLFAVLMIDMLFNQDKFFLTPFFIIRFILIGFLMLAFRHNALYAMLPAAIAALIWLKKYRLKTAAIFSVIILCYLVYSGPLLSALNVGKGSAAEFLSVPMQQLAATYKHNPSAFQAKDKKILFEYLPAALLPHYLPRFADPVKTHFNSTAFHKNKLDFFRLWLQTGLRNPGIYINAFLDNTLYAWYPNSIIDGYNSAKSSVYPEGKTSYFEFRIDTIGKFESKIPFLFDIYKNISTEKTINKIPVISMLFSVGFLFWVLALCLFRALYKKAYVVLFPFLLIAFLCLTIFFGPMILVRYFLILFFAFPLMFSFLANSNRYVSSC